MENAKLNLQIIDAGSAVENDERKHLLETTQPVESTAAVAKSSTIKKQRLINKINFLNFQEKALLVKLRHRKYGHTVSVPAAPQPCQDDRLECVWCSTNAAIKHLKQYEFRQLMIPDGQKLLLVEPELIQINNKGLTCRLPQTCCEVSARKISRYACKGIRAEVIQNGTVFEGDLVDFSAVSFRVRLKTRPPQTFQWFNHELPLTVVMRSAANDVYSGECRVLKQTGGQKTREYVLQPVKSEIQRFKHKEFRSARQIINPSPDIVFRHPLTGKTVNLKAYDISGSGFSVEEDYHNAVLLPGMVITDMALCFSNSYKLKCITQVVYRKICDEEGHIRCGLALLDMDIADHVKLVALLHQAENKFSYICNKVDLDSLWDFFFETGFIYPHKYAYIQKNKDKIKSVYEKLYTRNPDIARHFIYQDKGQILGHMAMVRFFENSWLIHHHAARSSVFNRAGIEVLNQIGRFGNDSHRLYSIHMDYLMCYYRPENKFPNRVFGGAVRSIKNPKGCSVDPFAYFHFNSAEVDAQQLPAGWQLTATENEDLVELENFYEHDSGGLMINALNIGPGNADDLQLKAEYHRLGFKREKHLFSLKQDSALKAVILVNISDIGLNLSDLTNCMTIIVVDPDLLTNAILNTALAVISERSELKEMPVLLYPSSFVSQTSLPFEKIYNLWVINLQFTDPYFSYLNRLLRFVKQ